MIETPKQYTERLLRYVDGREPIDVQAATAARLEHVIAGVSTTDLRRRPAADRWSVSEIVAHLADAEIVIGYRLRLILGSPGTSIVAYDQDRWATSGHYAVREPRKSVDLFHVLRESNLALLASLDAEQWTHYGIHSERGQESIADVVRMTAAHDLNHLRQIDEILVSA